jgi:hypothetical protein
MMSIEAMKQALEALQGHGYYDTTQQREAITSLRQAIAEAEKQEPVQVSIKDFVKIVQGKEDLIGRPIYWAEFPNSDIYPQPRKPLTDEQIKGIYEDCDAPTGGQFTLAFAKAIEAAHGIKE